MFISSSCRDLGLIFVQFALLLPVGQWVFDKSRVLLNLKQDPAVVSVVPVVFVVLKTSSSKAHRAIRVDLRYLCSLILKQLSRVRLLIRVLCAIRVSVVFTQNLPQKRNRLRCPTKQASLAHEASFIAQRSKLHFFGVFS